VERRLGRDDAFLERRQRHQDLEAAARRVLPLDDTVHERGQRVLAEGRPGGGLDTLGELVGVVGRQGEHGQDLAVARVEGHGAARPAGHRLLEGLLELRVQGQAHARPFHGRLTLGLRHLDPSAVDDHAAQAVLAHEQPIVLGLHPRLAHGHARVDPRVGLGLQLALRDLPHPAQHVRRALPQGVRPQGHGVHAGLGLLEAPGLDGGHVLLAGVGLDHHRAELRALLLRELLADVRGRDLQELGEALHAPVDVVRLLRREHDVEGGAVVHEDTPVAVEEQPAGRGYGHGPDAVVLRQVAVVLPAQDLQLPEVHDQEPHEADHHPLDDGQAPWRPRRSS
jgi:hypothetical protein